MASQLLRAGVTLSMGVIGVALLAGCHWAQPHSEVPETKTANGPSPSKILNQYRLHSPPPFTSGADVPRFLDWAGASHVDEREDVRNANAAGNTKEVVEALINEVERGKTLDHPRALLALSLLGETRSPEAQMFFSEFARRPLPTEGTVIEGEIIEQTRAAQLQAKAVDGLAYANNESSNQVVMEIIANHPSKIVRAEAINAYLWNHGDSPEARIRLSQYVRKDERILIDRVRRTTGETAESFNRKLDAFLKQHPEVIPPQPETLDVEQKTGTQRRAFEVKPPTF
ncbi:MAG TPA: hypothetical protein PLO50_06475 [Nitrospira sp.]|nr:hypothetical protein [Nitrospira sp.]